MEEARARRAAEALLNEHKTGVQFRTFPPDVGLASMGADDRAGCLDLPMDADSGQP